MNKISPLFLILVLFSGCKEKAPDLPIIINSPTAAIHYDETYQFVVKQGDKELSTQGYNWKSFDPRIGTIDANGLFSAKRIGKAKILIDKSGSDYG
ncbi:Ig-like domain-containing protein [Persicitalea sp.]|uniref:Ig-like domain-containing protein n=1 Tax=Persicitalea sp. TaxID=3100273 RepID=UPI003592FD6B